jgi:alkanesulfonate monooxygenase SsuD/methylene tetrahydromethanopterin reductase-like flavin-dependent oxidoreductase (luciferase family)
MAEGLESGPYGLLGLHGTGLRRAGFGVLMLPQCQHVLLAKQLSSIDILFRERLTVGIGGGYVALEMRANGVSLAESGARADEYLTAIGIPWTDPEPSFEGRFVSFDGVFLQQPPVQLLHPPLLAGGHSEASCRRAATTAHRWHGVYLDVEQAASALARLRKVAAGCERPAWLGEFGITIAPLGSIDLDTARRYAGLGVHQLAIQPGTEDGSDMEEVIESTGTTPIGRL